MSELTRPHPLDCYTPVGDLALSVRWLLRRALLPLLILFVGETGILFIGDSRGAMAFGLISTGTLAILVIWQTSGLGLPLLPLIALQNLLVYGLPIAINHEVLAAYPAAMTTRAGVEVFCFSCALVVAWLVGMEAFVPASPVSYALEAFRQEGTRRLKRLGFTLIVFASVYQLLLALDLLTVVYGFLPDGLYSIVQALVSAAGVCGFFLVSMFVGTGAISPVGRVAFWVLLAVNCLISAATFLLSATTAILAAVLIGLFWSTGRPPWRYLLIVSCLLGFLNVGKVTMRERYWSAEGDLSVSLTLTQLPVIYGEWVQASYEAITPRSGADTIMQGGDPSRKTQSLLERINNLQNLLFVIDSLETAHVTPLHGATYTLIPPLLVPRLFWPEKPRTHEGQVLLNVHFGRQELTSTYQTYIAWGLLPEALGNFGEIYGGLMLGAVLGLLCAWLENFTARKLLLSLEGFISFTILLFMASSFEMVASVLVTTIFQSVMLLIVASAFFVERTLLKRPESRPS